MHIIRRGLAAAAVAGVAIIGSVSPAHASALYDSNTQWYQTSGSGYYAAMTISTNATRTNSTHFRIDSGVTTGGVYYHGPYGDTPQTATALTQTWTISATGTGLGDCSIGFPSGVSCTIHTSTNVVGTDSTSFGASKPTSTSVPATTLYDGNSSFSNVKFQSTWKANYKINGTVMSRSPGENNIH
jgi:hypothetical protein